MVGTRFGFIAALAAFVIAGLAGGAPQATTYLVNTTADVHDAAPGTGGCASATGACSLRAAIEEANASAGDDVITLPAGYYLLSLGSLYVTSNIVIQGAGTLFGSTIDANHASGVFFMEETGTLSLSSMSLVNGNDTSMFYHGGCIFAEGPLYLNGVVISDCRTDHEGGGIYAWSTLVMTDCALLNNSADASGGGISLHSWASLERVFLYQNTAGSIGGGINAAGSPDTALVDCTVQGNHASQGGGIAMGNSVLGVYDSEIFDNTTDILTTGQGGGIQATNGTLTIQTSTLSNNTSRYGGGLRISAASPITPSLINVTIDGNTATEDGGGIAMDGPVTLGLSSVTITRNDPTYGSAGAIYGISGAQVELVNTLIAGNGMLQCDGISVSSIGYNLEPVESACLPVNATNVHATPLLGPLADNGGPTRTVALLTGSRGIDEGGAAFAPSTDQRGVARMDGDLNGSVLPDIGAYEYDLAIFRDDFEDGTTDRWSTHSP